jgi:hypothetical protein
VKAAGINPGEISIRKGVFAERWPATFPSGQGSDFAGVVDQTGRGVTNVAAGDEVIGFTHERASQAEFVVVEAGNLTPRPANVSWEQAGGLFVAGTTAFAAVRAVELKAGDTVVVSGAAGGVGSIAVQLARDAGAKVIGLAGEGNQQWLKDQGVIPVAYGDGVEARIRTASGGKVDAFVDTFGGGYVELAIKLGVAPNRINTIIDFAAAEKYHVKADGSQCRGAGAACRIDCGGKAGDPDCQGLSAEQGSRSVSGSRAAPHTGQDCPRTLSQFRNWFRPKRPALSWFSLKENHSSLPLPGHRNCETAVNQGLRAKAKRESPEATRMYWRPSSM